MDRQIENDAYEPTMQNAQVGSKTLKPIIWYLSGAKFVTDINILL